MCKHDSGEEREILESTNTLFNKYLNHEIDINEDTFKYIVSDVLYYWIYKNKVGQQKENNIRILYNNFFKLFLDILLLWKKEDTSTYKYKLATLCLYNGSIYRTIGFNSSINSEIKYDDLYTHWSKLDTKYIDSIESKVFKVKKYLSYKLKDNEYGIYIAPFIGMKQNEEEVVFPLYLKSKEDIKVKSKFLNDEEYTIKKLNELNNIFDIPKCRCLESLIIEMNYNFRKNKSC